MKATAINLLQHARLMELFRLGRDEAARCPVCFSSFTVKRAPALLHAECQGCGEVVRDNPSHFGTMGRPL